MTDRLEQYLPHVYRFALRLTGDRHLAEDLAHDTIVRALQRTDQVRSEKDLKAWLFRIAVNLHSDHHRRRATAARAMRNIAEPIETSRTDVALESEEDARAALSAMNSLPERQRAVLHLFAVEELSVSEITDVLGISPENVRTNLHYARAAMKQRLPHLWNPNTSADVRNPSIEQC